MSPLLLAAVLLLTTLLTAFISGLIGMAGGFVLMGVLVWLLPVSLAMVLHGFIQLTSNAWRAWLWRSYIQWRIVGQSLIGSALALCLIMLVQYTPEKQTVYLFMGLMPFVQFLLPQNLRLDVTRKGMGIVCGLVVTLMQLISGVAGGLLDQFYVHTSLDRRAQVATKAACQSIGHITKLIYFGGIVSGVAQLADLPLWVFPALIAAAMAGNSLAAKPLEKLSNVQFRLWSQRVLLALGVYYLVIAARLFWIS
jgi:uncharacterized protein